MINLRHLTQRNVVLYPKNGDRIVTIDSVTPLHPMYMFIIPAKARDYVFAGVGLSVCLSVCLFVPQTK